MADYIIRRSEKALPVAGWMTAGGSDMEIWAVQI
jgi:hypothetical protein